MGREIRMVPPNWEHPKDERGHLRPMYEDSYETARREWLEGLAAHKPEEHDGLDYWEWDVMPPTREDYRPWKDEEATWVQVWETVSEGTPITPPFATREELIEHLVTTGDAWDGKWSRKSAEAFCRAGWAPSMMIRSGKVTMGRDIPAALGQ